ncbi:MAG TPA: 1-deoxy-D-xylulose-5-phosphate synthase [Pseudoclavibacter sp.]|nr:1-deoxy-D-xylulose-5-phosphate synthase [Pseudoclavibacter sp.]
MGLLEGIHSPRDLDALTPQQLEELAAEIREFLVGSVARTGGHLGPNLGMVEATIALHRVFHSPDDAIVFDTGHQSYVHKLLTGRHDFSHLRERGGLAGYPQRSESVHDVVENSHASTSLSWADGIARAFELRGETDRHVVAVVGDGALTGGMTWEALNNISDDNNRKLVIVVNDNGRSYAPTIGGMARHLNELRTSRLYRSAFRRSRRFFHRLGVPGKTVFAAARAALRALQNQPTDLYSNLDIKYIGPINGHDIESLEAAFRAARDYGHPVVVHIITEKGRGYAPAAHDAADQFHAIGKFDPVTGRPVNPSTAVSWTKVFSQELLAVARENPRVVGITAAMKIPVGLAPFAEQYPDRVIDVGIAEQHAVASAAGLAFGGLHPVVAIYATFMNRAFDQVLLDVALHHAGVTFVLDRAGVTGPDGPSHHGVWDMALFQLVPHIRLAAPRDARTLSQELREAIAVDDAPTMIRYPKGAVGADIPAVRTLADGVDVLREAPHHDVLIVAVGAMCGVALDVAQLLAQQGIGATVVDPRWVVPVPRSVVELGGEYRLVVSIEDGIRVGGVGTRIRQDLRAAGFDTALTEIGLPDEFLEHATREQILHDVGLTAADIARDVTAMVLGSAIPRARPQAEQPDADAESFQRLFRRD